MRSMKPAPPATKSISSVDGRAGAPLLRRYSGFSPPLAASRRIFACSCAMNVPNSSGVALLRTSMPVLEQIRKGYRSRPRWEKI